MEQEVLEALEEGVVVVEGRRVVASNVRACRLLGVQELLNRTFQDLPRLPLVCKAEGLITECQNKRVILSDSFCDEQKVVELVATPRKKGAILVLEDRSSDRDILARGKNFITDVSHELKTPITIIQGFAETLQDLPKLPRSTILEITKKILNACNRMERLVTGFLNLADLENRALRFGQCKLKNVLRNCQELLLEKYPDTHFDVDIQGKGVVRADAHILEIAFMNLLENAIKYSPPPAHITIGVDTRENLVNLTIQDRGEGIPDKSLARIFERFYRDGTREGTGVGLSIVQEIIEKHQGTISALSQEGKGSQFRIVLPAF